MGDGDRRRNGHFFTEQELAILNMDPRLIVIFIYLLFIYFFNIRAQFVAEHRCACNVDLWIKCLQCVNWKVKAVQWRHVTSAIRLLHGGVTKELHLIVCF